MYQRVCCQHSKCSIEYFWGLLCVYAPTQNFMDITPTHEAEGWTRYPVQPWFDVRHHAVSC